MRKIIKIIVNAIGWILFMVILLGVVVSILINTPRIQSIITTKAFEKLESVLGNRVEFTKVHIGIFNKIELSDFLIKDIESDTIIFSPGFTSTFPGLLRKVVFKDPSPVRLGSLDFENAYFRLYTNAQKEINIKFIIDAIKSGKKPGKEPSPFFIDRIEISDSRFHLYSWDSISGNTRFDPGDLMLKELNISVKNMMVFTDTVSMDINKLTFVDKSGLRVEDFSSEFNLCNTFLKFDKLAFITNKSNFNLESLYFTFDTFKDFSGGKFPEKVVMSSFWQNSEINTSDLGFFTDLFLDVNQSARITGQIYGTLSNLNARKVNLEFGNKSYLKGKLDINGLPVAEQTFLMVDVDEFVTNIDDINSLNLPDNKKINLPDYLSNVTDFVYKGNFTGFFHDFVSYGKLQTNLGEISMDILIAPAQNNQMSFSGRLSSEQFNVGALTEISDKVGNISLDIDVDGASVLNEGFDVDLNGFIDKFDVNNYEYRNIQVDGNFANKRFNGKLNIDDPNAKVNFDGLFDLSSDIRQYSFTANILKANLFTLNINKKDPEYSASCLIEANISGNSIDELNGNVRLLNSLFSKSDAQIQVYDMLLDVRNDSVKNELLLNSDFLDGKISGHFKLSQLPLEYFTLLGKYLPAVSDIRQIDTSTYCDLTYQLRFKNCVPVFGFFLPDYSLDPNSVIEGKLERNEHLYSELHVESPEVTIKNITASNIVINSNTEKEKLLIDAGCENLNLSRRINFANLTFVTSIDSNQADFETRWLNWDSTLYRGDIRGGISLLNKPGEALISKVDVDSSILVINDIRWNISPFSISKDSSFVNIGNFLIRNENEEVLVNGKVSESYSDSLFCEFKDFDFSNLNYFTRSKSVRFAGLFDGKALIRGYTNPLMDFDLFISDFELNDQAIGDAYVQTSWRNESETLELNAQVMNGELKTIDVNGFLYPTKNQELDLEAKFNKFRIDFINPYMNFAFSDIRGIANGELSITGTTSEPVLNGELQLQKSALKVDYLNTRYNFSSDFSFSNNNLIFDNLLLFDEFGNPATLNGVIRTDYLKTFYISLDLDAADKFLFLNTTNDDNQLFYGTAYASGRVRFSGESSNLKIEVLNARTESGTIFNIPISGNEELSNYAFINYVSDDQESNSNIDEDFNVNFSGLDLDIKLKVTPNATVRIIVDPVVGDIIETTGEGDLRLALNPTGDFKIIGDYNIQKGSYNFTLPVVYISRRFEVEEGSSLRWTGDPVNADVNISTYHRVKASLRDLGDEFSEYTSSKTVDCQLNLSGKLMEPEISYDIYLPFSDKNTQEKVASRISTDEQKGKQFISLLGIRRFLYAGYNPSESGNVGGNDIVAVNATDIISNQLSNWVSQLSGDIGIGFNFSQGTETENSKELEVILDKQLLNDRLRINGDVNYKTNAEVDEQSSIAADFDVEYEISKSGKFRFKLFNHSTESEFLKDRDAPSYTQGGGFFFAEEFDTFGELWQNLLNKFSRKNNKEKNSLPENNSEAKLDENENFVRD